MIKTLFIPVQYKLKSDSKKLKKLLEKLPEEIAIAYSIQYKELAFNIKKIFPGKVNSIIQVLGCSRPNFPASTKAVLLIGSGRFHAVSLARETKLPIYIFEANKLYLIPKKQIEKYEKRKKTAKLRFLSEDKIGILVSTKPGQQRLFQALEIKKKIKKSSYIFISNNINVSEFENFKINSWINTACPRLDIDYPVINAYELRELNIGD